jgi:Ribosomal protein S8
MAVVDPVADMLTRIRNAHQAYHRQVDIPASKMKASIAGILKEKGTLKIIPLTAPACSWPLSMSTASPSFRV